MGLFGDVGDAVGDAVGGAVDHADDSADRTTDFLAGTAGQVPGVGAGFRWLDYVDETPRKQRWDDYTDFIAMGEPKGSGYLGESYSILDQYLTLGYAPGGSNPFGRPKSVAGDIQNAVNDAFSGGGGQGNGQSGGQSDSAGLRQYLLPAGVALAAVAAIVYGGDF